MEIFNKFAQTKANFQEIFLDDKDCNLFEINLDRLKNKIIKSNYDENLKLSKKFLENLMKEILVKLKDREKLKVVKFSIQLNPVLETWIDKKKIMEDTNASNIKIVSEIKNLEFNGCKKKYSINLICFESAFTIKNIEIITSPVIKLNKPGMNKKILDKIPNSEKKDRIQTLKSNLIEIQNNKPFLNNSLLISIDHNENNHSLKIQDSDHLNYSSLAPFNKKQIFQENDASYSNKNNKQLIKKEFEQQLNLDNQIELQDEKEKIMEVNQFIENKKPFEIKKSNVLLDNINHKLEKIFQKYEKREIDIVSTTELIKKEILQYKDLLISHKNLREKINEKICEKEPKRNIVLNYIFHDIIQGSIQRQMKIVPTTNSPKANIDYLNILLNKNDSKSRFNTINTQSPEIKKENHNIKNVHYLRKKFNWSSSKKANDFQDENHVNLPLIKKLVDE